MNQEKRRLTIDSLTSIEKLEQLSTTELQEHYFALNGLKPPFRASRRFLCGNLAWMLQVKQSGKDPGEVRSNFVTIAGRQSISPKTQYLPGTRLIREWQGVTHEVVIEEKGFRWQKQHYRSLSHIAREITGARWSGPRFFGLKERSLPRQDEEVTKQ